MKLIDTHLVLLSKAAQHEDKLLTRPDKVSDKAAQSLVTKLRRAGLVEELRVSRDQPHWRMDDENGPVGLRITQAGLIALGLDPEESATPKQPRSHTSRPGTKQALILELLSREEGASLDDLIAATGWLPHTTRAALTGLRQKGHALVKSKGEGGPTRYRISDEPEVALKAEVQA